MSTTGYHEITRALLGEHGAFYAQFAAIERLAASAGAPELRAAATLLDAALVSHARLEDELLFRAIDAAMPDAGPLPVMRDEHRRIEEALARARLGGHVPSARAALLEAIAISREHFLKEEEILFPLAEKVLDGEDIRTLGAAWAKARGVRG